MIFNHGETSHNTLARIRRVVLKVGLYCIAALMLPAVSEASQINNISVKGDGAAITISADEALEYQVFDLDGPPRVVINFPGANLKSGVRIPKIDGGSVVGIYPKEEANGVKVEIALSEPTGYRIEESENNLVVEFEVKPGVEESDNSSFAEIQDIEVRETGEATELVLRGRNMDSNHNAFLTNQNRTLILDFWGASSKLAKENYSFSAQRVRNVTVGHADGRVRLVVDLSGGRMSQQIDAKPGQMSIILGNVETKRTASSVTVESVDFQPDDRVAHIQIRTDELNPIVNINERDRHVVIDINKAALAKGMERSQDVSAFPGPVKQIDSYAVNDNVRIVARLRDKVDVSTFQQGNVITINFEPLDVKLARTKSADTGRPLAYSGQNVTFDFKEIDIANALKLISEMSALNFVMADDVHGKLSMRLVDVPWDQALDIILSSQQLGKEVEGNVMRIAPLEVLRKEHKEALEGQKNVEMIEPLITEPIALNFARVDDIKKMLEASTKTSVSTSPGTGEDSSTASISGGASILSSRGSYLVDERTNTLIVTDTEQAINNVKRFIRIVDRSIDQVLIESRIVEATSTFTEEFGIRWGGLYNDTTSYNFPNTITVGSAGGAGAASGMIVDLPAPSAGPGAGAALGISLGSFSNLINLDLELSAAEIEGLAKVVSTPRVLTSNGGHALISQGVDVPFVTPASGNSPATVTFKKAELKLDVTPQITANRTVLMSVDISNDAPTGQTVQGNPILATKKVTTNLQVKDGETIVIGGVFTKSDSDNEAGVPGVKDIPLLGWLFKTKQKLNNKTELLIFLTPKIMDASGGGQELGNRS